MFTETEAESRAEATPEPRPEAAVHEGAWAATARPRLLVKLAAGIAFVPAAAVATAPQARSATGGVKTESKTKWCVGPKLFGPFFVGSHVSLLEYRGGLIRLSIDNDISESIVMQRKLRH
ncbi:hypothetical protein MABM_30440 [Mycobacteroides abscessus]|nr:hypothetical protein MABM_30440 [Mycobacteroides abscessus]